jgi:hypothetical protein
MRSKPREHVCPLLPESGTNTRPSRYVRFVPIATQRIAAKAQLFDHLVGNGEEGRRHVEAE